MLFGETGRAREAVQALLILATLLLAILPITILNVPLPMHAVRLNLWSLPQTQAGPESGLAVATIVNSHPPRARQAPIRDRTAPVLPVDQRIARIELTASGRILFDGRPVDLVGLRMELDLMRERDATWLDLRPEPEARYELVDEILATIGRAGDFSVRIDHRPFRDAIG